MHGYLIINGAEPHSIDGDAVIKNVDPLDVFCGGFLCNAHGLAPAMTCIGTENAHSTVVGKSLFS